MKRLRNLLFILQRTAYFQIACNEDVYSPEELYRICMVAMKDSCWENSGCERIARPFVDKMEFIQEHFH